MQGGREELVLDEFQIGYRGFSVLDDVLYFISDDKRSGGRALFRLQLATGTVTRMTGFGDLFVNCPAITPDRRRVFYMVGEEKGSDLMVVENFR